MSENEEVMAVFVDKLNESTQAVKALSTQVKAQQITLQAMGGSIKTLETLEGKVESMQQTVASLSEVVKLCAAQSPLMSTLQNQLKNHIQFFEEPRKKEVRYTHVLQWPFLVVAG